MDPNTSIVLTHLYASAACAYLLELAKKSKYMPMINDYTKWLNRVARLGLSFVATVGITYAWSSGPNGGHILAISIPAGAVLMHTVWQWFGQYAMQHLFGQVLTLDNTSPTGLRLPTGSSKEAPAED